MSDRAWAATRKGLFELRRVGALWRVERVSFLGEPVTMLLAPQADGRMLAALNLGHFGVKLHASDDAGVHWREVSVPTYPRSPPTPGPGVEAGAGVGAGRGRSGPRLGRHLARRTVRESDDFGSQLALCEALWHQPGRSEWFGGGYPCRASTRSARTRSVPARCCWASAAAAPGSTTDDGRQLGAALARHACRLHAARAAEDPERAGPAPDRALPSAARGAVVPASQRHLAQHRRRRSSGTS
jgi:hypothetical protein